MTAATDSESDVDAVEVAGYPRWLIAVLAGVCALALFVAGGAVAVVTGIGSSATGSLPADDSVDAGFARDMMAHHNQAVLMAGFVRDHTADPTIRLLAYDTETQQLTEVGLFKGWLDGWGLLAESDHAAMSWMGTEHMHMQSGNLMPGMATTAELAKLKSLTGRPLDIYFLQLMIRHHQGGIPMASYAAEHATVPAVRTAAHKMADAQSLDVINMEQLLRSYGAAPLAPPS
jgi:uncharacterized protein (DUF305 family)